MTKTFDQALTEITQIIRVVLDSDDIVLKRETTAQEVEKWDSLSHIEIVVAVEKHFKIRFNFAELQKFKNVGEMCDNIVTRLARAGGV